MKRALLAVTFGIATMDGSGVAEAVYCRSPIHPECCPSPCPVMDTPLDSSLSGVSGEARAAGNATAGWRDALASRLTALGPVDTIGSMGDPRRPVDRTPAWLSIMPAGPTAADTLNRSLAPRVGGDLADGYTMRSTALTAAMLAAPPLPARTLTTGLVAPASRVLGLKQARGRSALASLQGVDAAAVSMVSRAERVTPSVTTLKTTGERVETIGWVSAVLAGPGPAPASMSANEACRIDQSNVASFINLTAVLHDLAATEADYKSLFDEEKQVIARLADSTAHLTNLLTSVYRNPSAALDRIVSYANQLDSTLWTDGAARDAGARGAAQTIAEQITRQPELYGEGKPGICANDASIDDVDCVMRTAEALFAHSLSRKEVAFITPIADAARAHIAQMQATAADIRARVTVTLTGQALAALVSQLGARSPECFSPAVVADMHGFIARLADDYLPATLHGYVR